MEGSLVAIGLLLMIGLTGFAIVRYRRPVKHAFGRLVLTIVIGMVVGSLLFPVMAHPHVDIASPKLLLIPMCCAIFGIGLPNPPLRIQIGLGIIEVFLFLAIPIYSGALAYSPDYTGYTTTQYHIRSAAVDLNYYAKDYPDAYPAGWLRDMPFAKEFRERDFHGYQRVPHRLWHTWLTGLYREERIPGEVWYLGGRIKDDRELEIRPRQGGGG